MQCPPTSPGLKGKKFHLVPAAASTSPVSMLSLSKINASSLMKLMLTSRWAFSIAFAASATLMLGARCVPAVIILLFKRSTSSAAYVVEPEVTLSMLVTLRCLSPGLMRSGL